MMYRTLLCTSVVLGAALIDAAAAQTIRNVFMPGGSLPSPSPPSQPSAFRDARPFGAQQQLPGQRIEAPEKIIGKWLHRETKRNALFENMRLPQLFTSISLHLRPDNSFTLDYQAVWGGTTNTPEATYASLDTRETGHFSVSRGVLLLEVDAGNVIQRKRGKRTEKPLSSERRAYVISLDGSYLNLVGACTTYQAEELCTHSRSVWWSLLPPSAAQRAAKSAAQIRLSGSGSSDAKHVAQ